MLCKGYRTQLVPVEIYTHVSCALGCTIIYERSARNRHSRTVARVRVAGDSRRGRKRMGLCTEGGWRGDGIEKEDLLTSWRKGDGMRQGVGMRPIVKAA